MPTTIEQTRDDRQDFAAVPAVPQPAADDTALALAVSGWQDTTASGTPAVQVFSTSIMGDPGPTSQAVTPWTALSIPAVWCATNWLASNLAGLPKKVYRKAGTTRQLDDRHPLNWLLNDEPSELATPQVFWETLYHHAVIHGNGYALIERDGPDVAALYNLPPDRVAPFRVEGQQWYAIEVADGQYRPIPAAAVLHVPGLGFDGMAGIPVIHLLREALGIGRNLQTYTANFFRNGGLLGGTLETDRTLTPEQVADLKRSLAADQAGLTNSHKWHVLQAGLKAKPLGIPPENAQLVELSQSHLYDICRVMQVEPFVIKEYGRATWSNLESQNTQAVQYSLMPWILRTEAEINRKLFSRAERRQLGYFVGMNVDALVRGDHSQQIESASKRLAAGLTTPDEERALMDLPAYPGGIGSGPRVAANTVPLQPDAPQPPDQPAAGQTFDRPPAVAVTLDHFRPAIQYAAGAVHSKTAKAVAAHEKHKGTPGWVPWVNTFTAEQEGYAAAAVAPILASYGAAAGTALDHEKAGRRIGRAYGAKLRGHLYHVGQGGDSTAPDLAEITFALAMKGEDEEA